jgi:hypothetical protein
MKLPDCLTPREKELVEIYGLENNCPTSSAEDDRDLWNAYQKIKKILEENTK